MKATMILGSHLSIAGGLHNAVLRAGELGLDCVALFVRNQVQWAVPELSDDRVKRFRKARRELAISPVVAHGSYLVNLAGNETIRRKSIAAMIADLHRCGRLGVEYLVFHPGTHPDAELGIEKIVGGVNKILRDCSSRKPKLLLETTAGQGNSIVHTFEQLAAILAGIRRKSRVGICLDTAHVFAAGYDLRTPKRYRATMEEFDRLVGLQKLKAIHLNDSKKPLGSRVDRHEHIGRGQITARGFGLLVRDPRLADVPMILETPKGTDKQGRDWDRINALALRRLARRKTRRSGRPADRLRRS
jgi:deoxyribonuclease-4